MNTVRTTPLTIRRLLGAVVMFAATLGLWRVALAEDRSPAGWLPASLALVGAAAFAGGTGIVFRRSLPLIATGFAAPAFLIAVDRIWQLLLGRELPGRAHYVAFAVALACLLLGAAWLPIQWWKRAAAALALLVLLAIEIFVLAMLSLAWGGMEGVTGTTSSVRDVTIAVRVEPELLGVAGQAYFRVRARDLAA